MHAKEAQALTENAIKDANNIQPWLDVIYRKIREAANKGERHIFNPLEGVRMASPSAKQAASIWLELQGNGYNVEHLSDSQVGSKPHTTISW
jgi:hypothetical protein